MESILFNERLTNTWDPDCIMLTETCNHKDKRENANNFNKIIENIGK